MIGRICRTESDNVGAYNGGRYVCRDYDGIAKRGYVVISTPDGSYKDGAVFPANAMPRMKSGVNHLKIIRHGFTRGTVFQSRTTGKLFEFDGVWLEEI